MLADVVFERLFGRDKRANSRVSSSTANSPIIVTLGSLQWGGDNLVAESATRRRRPRDRLVCFNGAATISARNRIADRIADRLQWGRDNLIAESHIDQPFQFVANNQLQWGRDNLVAECAQE
jgi:hypothetical protein